MISTYLEHNSVLRVLMGLEKRGQISVTLLRPREEGMIDPEEIRRAIAPRTRLLVLTHASNVTGAIQPVAAAGEIAREAGLLYLIDGAQALGCNCRWTLKSWAATCTPFPGTRGCWVPRAPAGFI